MFIYVITNTINGKQYVGQTTRTVKKRFEEHCKQSLSNTHNMLICKAIAKYGKENFKVELICKCHSLKTLNKKETFYIKKLNTLSPNGYNLTTGGNRDKKLSEEARQNASKAQKRRFENPAEKEKVVKILNDIRILSNNAMAKKFKDPKYMEKVRNNMKKVGKLGAKTYKIIDPFGKELLIKNASEFARNNNLNQKCFYRMLSGERKSYKGYKKCQ